MFMRISGDFMVELNVTMDPCEKSSRLNDDVVSGTMFELLSIDVEQNSNAANKKETSCSKNVMRKQRNWERRLEAKRSKRKEEKERRKQNQREKDVAPQFSKRVLKVITKERLELARESGPRLCVDLSMTECMSHKEISRLAGQIRRLYGTNKKATQPFHLFLTEMKKESLLYQECMRMNTGFLNYLIDISEESWVDLFPSEDIVYLTPDASEALEQVDVEKIYILGGLVDESIQKKISYTRAKEFGVRMARLPIDEYMVKKPNAKNFHSKILAINQVFEILMTFHDTGSWTTALSTGIPAGKGYTVNAETTETGHDQNSSNTVSIQTPIQQHTEVSRFVSR